METHFWVSSLLTAALLWRDWGDPRKGQQPDTEMQLEMWVMQHHKEWGGTQKPGGGGCCVAYRGLGVRREWAGG